MKKNRTHKLLARLAGGVDNRLNPIMAKEMYQSVHSRAFMVSFWLLLGLALLIYITAWNIPGDDVGSNMFVAFYSLMAFMGLILLPLGAFYALRKEITTHTFELVEITGITAQRLARGRVLAVAVRLVLLCSVLAPFAVLSYLFGGVDLLTIASSTYLLMLCSLLVTATGVWCATFGVYHNLRYLSQLAFPLAFPLLIAAFIFIPEFSDILDDAGEGGFFAFEEGWGYLLLRLGLTTALGAILLVLLLAATTHALTFPCNPVSTGVKIITLAFVFAILLYTTLAEGVFGFSDPAETINIVFLLACTVLSCGALGWMLLDTSPRRVRRAGKRFTRLLRNGPGPTIRFLLLAEAFVFVICVLMLWLTGDARTSNIVDLLCVLTGTLTLVIYTTAVARMITGWLPRKRRTPDTRLLVLLLLGFLNYVVAVLLIPKDGMFLQSEPGVLTAFAPLIYRMQLDGGHVPESEQVISHMILPALFGICYYIRLAKRSAPQESNDTDIWVIP